MSNFRRVYISGGIYFFTLVTCQRQPIFSDPQRVSLLRQSFLEVKPIARSKFWRL
jgi:putative transposase